MELCIINRLQRRRSELFALEKYRMQITAGSCKTESGLH